MDETHIERLDAYLDEQDLASVWFARPNSFAWLTGGDNVVDRAGDHGVAAAGYDGDEVTVVTNDIEAGRLADEELPADATVESFPWHASSLAEAVAEHGEAPLAADFDVPGASSVDAGALRQPLTAADVDAYRELGSDVAETVEGVCRELSAEDTERDVAAALHAGLAARDVESPVVLVGGGERAQQYRHYTPKDDPLGDYALVSVTAERGGLCASCTRTVAFDPPEWLGERHSAAALVEVTALAATQVVADLSGEAGSVFDAIQAAYEHVDYPDEWERHHQGGAAGYAGREWIATPDSTAPVTTPMAYAWNPTVQGAKSEDTVLVSEDGFETLTTTGDWPTSPVRAHDYDLALQRHDVLHL